MDIARTIAKNTVFNFIGTASDMVITFVTGIVLARGLGADEYGLYSYLMWFLSLAALIANLGLAEMSKRFIPEALGRQSPYEPKSFVQLTLMLRGVAALVICLVIVGSSGYLARLTGNQGSQTYFIIIAFSSLPHALMYALEGIFGGFQRYDYVACVELGINPLRMALIIVLLSLGFGVYQVLILHLAVLSLGVVIGLFLLRRLIPLRDLFSHQVLEAATKRRALRYALTMTGLKGLEYLAYQQAGVFIISLYCPVRDVGFYNLATRLSSTAMALVPSAFGLVLMPAIAEQFGGGDTEKIRRIYLTSARYLMIFTLPIAAGMIALSSPIITLLYGVDYAPAIILMQILIVPVAIFNIGHAAGAVIFGIGRADFTLKVNFVLSFVNIGLSVWLTSRYGVVGATIASSVPLVLNVTLGINFASGRIGASWPMRDMIKIVLAASVMGLIVYLLQNQLGAALSLALCIPLGIAIYIAGILVLRIMGEQDLAILKRIQSALPVSLRKRYVPLVQLMERIVGKTKLAGGD